MCPISGSQTQFIMAIHIGARGQKELDNLRLLERRRQHQRSLICLIRAVYINALGQQRPHAVDIAERGSTEEIEDHNAHGPRQ